jgi:hypothetical protein
MPVPNPIRITAKLPKESANGWHAQHDDLIGDRKKIRLAIVAYNVAKLEVDTDEDSTTALVRLLRVEPLEGKAETVGRKLLAEAASRRTGDQLSLDSFDEWAAGTDDGDDE